MQKARTAFGAAWEEADDFSDGEEHEAGTDKVVSCKQNNSHDFSDGEEHEAGTDKVVSCNRITAI